jgi:hypothetical protein
MARISGRTNAFGIGEQVRRITFDWSPNMTIEGRSHDFLDGRGTQLGRTHLRGDD